MTAVVMILSSSVVSVVIVWLLNLKKYKTDIQKVEVDATVGVGTFWKDSAEKLKSDLDWQRQHFDKEIEGLKGEIQNIVTTKDECLEELFKMKIELNQVSVQLDSLKQKR